MSARSILVGLQQKKTELRINLDAARRKDKSNYTVLKCERTLFDSSSRELATTKTPHLAGLRANCIGKLEDIPLQPITHSENRAKKELKVQ